MFTRLKNTERLRRYARVYPPPPPPPQCSELVTLQFGDIDGHLSQTMQKIAGRMGLHFTIQRKEVCISGPFDLVQQFRMDLRAEVFLTAQCSSFTSVMSAASQSVPSVLATSKKAPQIPFSAPRETTTGSMNSKINEIPSEVQNNTDAGMYRFEMLLCVLECITYTQPLTYIWIIFSLFSYSLPADIFLKPGSQYDTGARDVTRWVVAGIERKKILFL